MKLWPPLAGPLDPAEFVDLLTRLGPTATKIGQYLALRPDLLPQEYCDELLRLTDQGKPFGWPLVERVIIAELGDTPDRLFRRFERRPVGVGSLSQVHRAQLEDGAEVAVKIQRPGVEALVARDIRRLRLAARLVKRIDFPFPLTPADLADELAEWLRQEIDFTRECENARRLLDLTARSETQVVPFVYRHLSSPRLITYEYLEGVTISKVLAEMRGTVALPASGPLLTAAERRDLAARLVVATLTQIFRLRFFHADLHPGNLVVLPGGKIGYVDFGLCDTLDDTVRANQLRYVAAVYTRDQARMFTALTGLLVARADSDFEGLRRDFLSQTRRLGDARRDNGRSSAAGYIVGVMRAARNNRFAVPRQVLSLYRALLAVETLAKELGLPNALQQAGRSFIGELQREDALSQLFDRDKLQQILASTLTLARDGPGQIAQILADAAEGSVRLKVEVSDSGRTEAAQNRRARLLAAAILSVGVAVPLASNHLPSVFGLRMAWPLGALLAGLYLVCLSLWLRL